MVRERIFNAYPTEDVPLTIDERLRTKDACIEQAVQAFLSCGAGFKNSTSSDDPRIKTAGMKSANIVMRPMIRAFAMLRMLQGPGRYEKPCGTLRYGYGGIYNEVACVPTLIRGRRVAVVTQHFDLDGLIPFADLAAEIAKEHKLQLILSSKSPIAPSEQVYRSTIEDRWLHLGLIAGKEMDRTTGKWSGDFHHQLTDIALANLPIQTAHGSECSKGGFLHVCDNPNGDISSDIIDLQHGNRVMSSTVYCMSADGKRFTYEELPGGTAPDLEHTDMTGKNFVNPVGIIFALASAFEQVNPEQHAFFAAVRDHSLKYVLRTPPEECSTKHMIDTIMHKTTMLMETGITA